MNLLTSKKWIWTFGMLFAISQGCLLYIMLRVAPIGEIIAQQTSLSSLDFLKYLIDWGPRKLGLFLSHYYLDFAHPLIYALFFTACITQLWSHTKYWMWMALFPVLAALSDLAENLCQLPIILGWIPADSIWFYVGAISSRLKWFYLAVTFAFILIGLLRRPWKALVRVSKYEGDTEF